MAIHYIHCCMPLNFNKMKNTKTPYELRIEGLEAGAASIFIKLSQGTITVKHGTDGTVLKQIDRAKDGSWNKIWDSINDIKSVD